MDKAEQIILGDKVESKKDQKLTLEIQDSRLISRDELMKLVSHIEKDCQQDSDKAKVGKQQAKRYQGINVSQLE